MTSLWVRSRGSFDDVRTASLFLFVRVNKLRELREMQRKDEITKERNGRRENVMDGEYNKKRRNEKNE